MYVCFECLNAEINFKRTFFSKYLKNLRHFRPYFRPEHIMGRKIQAKLLKIHQVPKNSRINSETRQIIETKHAKKIARLIFIEAMKIFPVTNAQSSYNCQHSQSVPPSLSTHIAFLQYY